MKASGLAGNSVIGNPPKESIRTSLREQPKYGLTITLSLGQLIKSQEQLYHDSVKTTMIYTHAANLGAGVRSLLDGWKLNLIRRKECSV